MEFTATFHVPDHDKTDAREIELILYDALYEFVSHRGPTAEEYVAKRYPHMSEKFRADKIPQVNHRVIICDALHNSLSVERTK